MKLEGIADLHAVLQELPRSATRSVLTRVAIAALIPFAKRAAAGAARLTGHLAFSIGVGTKLSRRQAQLHEKIDEVEVFAGPAALPQATQEEFGGEHNTARPYMRPAWDAEKDSVLPRIGADLWQVILAAVLRRAARAQSAADKGGQ